MTKLTKNEKVIVTNAYKILYSRGSLVPIKDVPLGSVVIMEHSEEYSDPVYAPAIVFRKTKKQVRVAFTDGFDLFSVDTDGIVPPDTLVVVLQATCILPPMTGRYKPITAA